DARRDVRAPRPEQHPGVHHLRGSRHQGRAPHARLRERSRERVSAAAVGGALFVLAVLILSIAFVVSSTLLARLRVRRVFPDVVAGIEDVARAVHAIRLTGTDPPASLKRIAEEDPDRDVRIRAAEALFASFPDSAQLRSCADSLRLAEDPVLRFISSLAAEPPRDDAIRDPQAFLANFVSLTRDARLATLHRI